SDPGFDADPDWSPDASKIVFASDRDGEFDLYVMNGDGSGITRLTDGPGLDFNPRWSADGSKIAFARRAPGSTNDARIYVMNA
ncbi:MAG: hypothetical protein GWN79_09480, partial [Actinobacteria bacterium]|nr:hypothetical protein [Actinomycetota bacterium]NIS31313.1 hypothetical protein [Actinomycetota bacterium]NIU19296.1 hypothetical protein [Actinomycetota bacterium]NIU66433.1 hypothetical protein [Actinomycetota bacterium]NIV87181.1 hypothetical protein [Actinomycetota bacterium]